MKKISMASKDTKTYLICAFAAWIVIGLWPNSYIQSDANGMIEKTGPSLFESLTSGSILFNADPGGMLPLHAEAYRQSTLLEPLLWNHKVGSGRPAQPFDGYNFGYLDPIQLIWKTVIPEDFLRFISVVNLSYILILCLCVVWTFRRFCRHPILLSLAPIVFYGVAQVTSYPNMFSLLQQMIIILLGLEIFLDWHERCEPSSRQYRLWLFIGILLPSSAAFSLVPLVFVCGVTMLFLISRRILNIKNTFLFCIGLLSTLMMSAPAVLPSKVFQSLSTNATLPYIGYGFQLNAIYKALLGFGHTPGLGLAIIAISTASVLAGRQKRFVLPFLAFTLTALFGIAGGFDKLQLAVGLNIQATNTYLPLTTSLLVFLLFISVGHFESSSLAKGRLIHSLVVGLCSVVMIAAVATGRLHQGIKGVILISNFNAENENIWLQHPRNLGIESETFRTVSLHHQIPDSPTKLVHLTGENVNWFYIYPLSAPFLGLSEPTGSSSLTLKNYSDFLDVINYGMSWDSHSHPQRSAWPEYRARMASGKIVHSETAYGEMAQQKRNNLLIWNPDSPLLKYTGTKWILSAQPINSSRLKLLRKIHDPISYGREFRLAKRIPTLFIYELTDALGKAWFPSKIESSVADREMTFANLVARSRTESVALINELGLEVAHSESSLGASRVLSYRELINAIEVDVETLKESLLVLAVPWFPGWSAKTKNEELTLVKVNETFIGVKVPAGRRTIRFEFSHPAIKWGLFLGLLGTLGNLFMISLFLRPVRLSARKENKNSPC